MNIQRWRLAAVTIGSALAMTLATPALDSGGTYDSTH
jgi:hypothetical protein